MLVIGYSTVYFQWDDNGRINHVLSKAVPRFVDCLVKKIFKNFLTLFSDMSTNNWPSSSGCIIADHNWTDTVFIDFVDLEGSIHVLLYFLLDDYHICFNGWLYYNISYYNLFSNEMIQVASTTCWVRMFQG